MDLPVALIDAMGLHPELASTARELALKALGGIHRR